MRIGDQSISIRGVQLMPIRTHFGEQTARTRGGYYYISIICKKRVLVNVERRQGNFFVVGLSWGYQGEGDMWVVRGAGNIIWGYDSRPTTHQIVPLWKQKNTSCCVVFFSFLCVLRQAWLRKWRSLDRRCGWCFIFYYYTRCGFSLI